MFRAPKKDASALKELVSIFTAWAIDMFVASFNKAVHICKPGE